MEWSPDGDFLAIVQDASRQVVLWSLKDRTQRTLNLFISGKSISSLQWVPANSGLSFIVVSNSGRLYKYEVLEEKLVEWATGSTARRKLRWCGWSSKNGSALLRESCFGCAFDDATLLFFDRNGRLLENLQLQLPVDWLGFCPTRPRLFCGVLGAKQLLLYEIGEERQQKEQSENPSAIEFDEAYGMIIGAGWFEQGRIVVGFSAGVILALTLENEKVAMEKTKGMRNPMLLSDLCVNERGLCAVTGGGALFVVDLTTLSPVASKIILKETYARTVAKLNKMASFTPSGARSSRTTLQDSRERLMSPKWNDAQGDILSVATNSGFLFGYAAKGIAGGNVEGQIEEAVSLWSVLLQPLSLGLVVSSYLCAIGCMTISLSIFFRVEAQDFIRVCLGIAEVI